MRVVDADGCDLRAVQPRLEPHQMPRSRPSNPSAPARATRGAFGGLWPDLSNAEAVIAGKQALGWISEEEAEQLRAWRRDGFVILPQAVSADDIDRLDDDVERIWAGTSKHRCFVEFWCARSLRHRFNDLAFYSYPARDWPPGLATSSSYWIERSPIIRVVSHAPTRKSRLYLTGYSVLFCRTSRPEPQMGDRWFEPGISASSRSWRSSRHRAATRCGTRHSRLFECMTCWSRFRARRRTSTIRVMPGWGRSA